MRICSAPRLTVRERAKSSSIVLSSISEKCLCKSTQQSLASGAADNLFRQFEMLRPDANIDVAIGPERPLGIQTRRGPALRQHRINPRFTQQPKKLFDLLFVDLRLQRDQPIGLVKHLTRSGIFELGLAKATPSQGRSAGIVKQRRYFVELGLGKL